MSEYELFLSCLKNHGCIKDYRIISMSEVDSDIKASILIKPNKPLDNIYLELDSTVEDDNEV